MKTKMFKRLMLTRTETLSSKMEGQSKMIHKYLEVLQRDIGTINTQNVAIHDIVKHLVLTDELNTIFRNASSLASSLDAALTFIKTPQDILLPEDEQILELHGLSKSLHDIHAKNLKSVPDRRPDHRQGKSGHDIPKKSSRKSRKPQVDHQKKQKSPRIYPS